MSSLQSNKLEVNLGEREFLYKLLTPDNCVKLLSSKDHNAHIIAMLFQNLNGSLVTITYLLSNNYCK